MVMGRPTKYDPKFCKMLIDHMKQGFSFESFAAKVGCHWDSLYEWLKVYPEFSEAKKEGKALELAVWENIAMSGASGIPMNVPNLKGKVNNPNAALIIFSMKNKFPKLYRDQIKVEADVNVNSSGFEKLGNKEKAKVLSLAAQAKLKKTEEEDDGSDG